MKSLGNFLFLTFYLLSAILFLTSCKKDILVPNPECGKLFGTWIWIESSGGFAGELISPATQGEERQVIFKENGIFKRIHDGRMKDRMSFRFIESESIHSMGKAILIDYKVRGWSKKGVVPQYFRFGGSDTLFLYDECHDCYSHSYIRKK